MFMSIKHCLGAIALASLMIASCLTFTDYGTDIDASDDTPDVVVIYSTIESDDSLTDIISEQEKVYAEKEYYESNGSKVVLVATGHLDVNDMSDEDRQFVQDMFDFIGYDRNDTKDLIRDPSEGAIPPAERTGEARLDEPADAYESTTDADEAEVADTSTAEIVIDEDYESQVASTENTDDFKVFVIDEIAKCYGTSYSTEILNLIHEYGRSLTTTEGWNDPLDSKEEEQSDGPDLEGSEYCEDQTSIEENDDEEQEDVFEMPSCDAQDEPIISMGTVWSNEEGLQLNTLKAGIGF